jgi:hypothetical protein
MKKSSSAFGKREKKNSLRKKEERENPFCPESQKKYPFETLTICCDSCNILHACHFS